MTRQKKDIGPLAKLGLSLGLGLLGCMSMSAKDLVWYDGTHSVTCYVPKGVDPVVEVASEMFADDMKAVTGRSATLLYDGKSMANGAKASVKEKEAIVRLVQLDKASSSVKKALAKQGVPVAALQKKTDGFHISVIGSQIVIVGANGRGTAYGLLELSRLAGVTPWIWWGDVVPKHQDRLVIDDSFTTLQGASVEWRGIFINDEDWSLRPWSYTNFEKGPVGRIGRNTYKKVFQLLMRLRANAIWPAMHEGTTSFFKVPGAKAVADSCGIAVGSSHCEPLLRSNTGEWDVGKRGRYNYITNKAEVQRYWAERLDEVKGSKGGNLLTIGMRGIHDGSMEGVKTMQGKFDALQQVINDQQELIRRHLGDPSRQTQVFIPYKEVLDIYNMGLKVPDYVTLMWCDDNYGYLTRLPDAKEQRRSGGGGIYYHLSYWGRPHDHLWLTTTQPGLIYNEMKAAYDHNVRKIWIANVHDPKVAGYDLQLFLDMAWDISSVTASSLESHYKAWLCRQFGQKAGEALFPAMKKFYQLCGERRPEFMGWTQVELDKKKYPRGLSPVTGSELSATAFGNERERYLESYAVIASKVKDVASLVRPELQDAYFAAIEYPVLAAEAHARKLLRQSNVAYQEIKDLTYAYNKKMANGKWDGLMDMQPRSLPVFEAPKHQDVSQADKEKQGGASMEDTKAVHPLLADGVIARNACDCQKASVRVEPVQMLGHSMNAVPLPKDQTLHYDFTTDKDGDALLKVALIPSQPNDKGDLRFSVSVDGAEPVVFSLKEPFRSERWKLNVLRGQAVRDLPLDGLKAGRHTLVIKALDDHIVIDQWMIDYDLNRKFYLFPTE